MSTSRKATFVLPERLLEEMRAMVDLGLAESVSALVRRSLEEELRRMRDIALEREFAEAAEDPLFMADLADCARDFSSMDAEGLG